MAWLGIGSGFRIVDFEDDGSLWVVGVRNAEAGDDRGGAGRRVKGRRGQEGTVDSSIS